MKPMNVARKYGQKLGRSAVAVGSFVVGGLAYAADPATVSELATSMSAPAAEAKLGALAIAGIIGGVLALMFAIYLVLGMMKKR